MKQYSPLTYATLFISTFLLDRITKYWAINTLQTPHQINNFLSLDLVYNRGISWSFFDFTDHTPFVILSIIIALIIAGVGFYTYIRWMNHYPVIGELLILSGALSNLIDRIFHSGVVDFIHLSAHGWSWPIFNIADIWIICGVIIIFMFTYTE